MPGHNKHSISISYFYFSYRQWRHKRRVHNYRDLPIDPLPGIDPSHLVDWRGVLAQGAVPGLSEMQPWLEPLPSQGLPCPVHWCFNSKPKDIMRNLLSEEHNSLDSCPISIQGALGTGKGRESLPHHFVKHRKPYLATHPGGNLVQRNMEEWARAGIWSGIWVLNDEWSRCYGS